MLLKLFLLFTLVPLVELAILVKLGSVFGVLHTIILVIVTGLIGASLARIQGLRVLRQFDEAVRRGEVPTDPLIEGALVLMAAAFLVTPGVVTDITGFLLIIPGTRKIASGLLRRYVKIRISSGAGAYYTNFDSGSHKRSEKNSDDDDIIDV